MSKIAVLGYGTVGSGVVELFYKNKAKEASIEDRLWCYEPKIEQLEREIELLEKEDK